MNSILDIFSSSDDKSKNDNSELINQLNKCQTELTKTKKELSEAQVKLDQIDNTCNDLNILLPDKTFGIAVCGDVLLTKLEVKIVDTPQFQRLRKVKQLGAAFLVYPSAVHTRFEHSLGVLKMADVIINHIRNNKHNSKEERLITVEEEEIIRLMALLHDIGHMPYGHTIEDEFGIFKSHDRHQTRWDYLLGENSRIGIEIIKEKGKEFHNKFFKLITCNKIFDGIESQAFMYDIVSDTVCADLLDYLKRDSVYTNLKLNFHPRFLNYFLIKNIENSKGKIERRIAIRVFKKGKNELRVDTISDLIQLLRNRFYIGQRVYFHHTKLKFGAMIAGAVARAELAGSFAEEKIEDEELLIRIKEDEIDDEQNKRILKIHLMGDDELLNYLLHGLSLKGKSEESKKLINGAQKLAIDFNNRVKYKQVLLANRTTLGIPIDSLDYPLIDKLTNGYINPGTFQNRVNIEEEICNYLDMDSGSVLVYCPSFKMAMKPALAKIEKEDGKCTPLEHFSHQNNSAAECKTINDNHKSLWAFRVFVHPKFIEKNHIEYSESYATFKQIICEYFEWKMLSVGEKEKTRGERFWNTYINYILSIIQTNESDIFKLKKDEELAKIAKLTENFMSEAYDKNERSLKSIIEAVKNEFNI
jgi:HD superfamily phosphohydrolase